MLLHARSASQVKIRQGKRNYSKGRQLLTSRCYPHEPHFARCLWRYLPSRMAGCYGNLQHHCKRLCLSGSVYYPEKCFKEVSRSDCKKVKVDNVTLAPVPLELENAIYDRNGKLVKKHSQNLELTPQVSAELFLTLPTEQSPFMARDVKTHIW